MSFRRTLATFLLLPTFVLLERGSWYGFRAILFLFRIGEPSEGGLGLDTAEVASGRAFEQLLIPMLVVIAGALGAAVGPQALLIIGTLLALPGMVMLGVPVPAVGAMGAVVVIVGHAVTMPGVMASAASALRGRAEHLRTAVMALIYTAINLGAFLGAASTGALQSSFGFRPVFLCCAGVMLLALIVSGLLGGATLWTRAEVAAGPEPVPPTGRLLLGSLGLAAVVLVPWLCSLQCYELVYTSMDIDAMPGFLQGRWFDINPLVCMATGLLIALAAGGLHLTKLRVSALFPMALGLLLLALGQFLMLVASAPGSPWFAIAGLAVVAVGEATLMVFLTSRMLGDLPWRFVALVGGLWLAGTYGGSSLFSWLGSLLELPWWSQAVGWAGVGTAVLAALILAIAAVPARRMLWTAVAED